MRALASLALALPGLAWGVTAADHRGELVADRIVWVSTFELERGETHVELAVPVSLDDLEVVGGRPELDARGAVIGLVVTDARGTVTVRGSQPMDAAGLQAPVATGPALQRVVQHGFTLDPGPDLTLERHVGHWATAGVRRSDRKALDRRLDGRFRVREGSALYVVGDTLGAGLPGTVTPRDAGSRGVAWAAALIFVGVLALGVPLHRWLEAGARRDRVERYLREEMGDLPAPPDP